MLCDDLEGWDVGNGIEIQERGDARTHTPEEAVQSSFLEGTKKVFHSTGWPCMAELSCCPVCLECL